MKINLPNICESCNSSLVWSDTGVDLLCVNLECPAQVLYRIEYFLRTLGVEEISSTTLEKFNLKNIHEVYSLTESYISSLDGFAEKKAKIIVSEIRKSIIDVHPPALIAAFGILGVGLKNAEKIYKGLKKLYGDLEPEKLIVGFFKCKEEFFLSLEGFAEKSTNQIIKNREKFIPLYRFLLREGITFRKEIKGKLTGEIIVMTGGSPDGRSRPTLENLISDHGGENGKSINKTTTLLIAENPHGHSNKIKKAKEYNIPIISYEEFFDRVE